MKVCIIGSILLAYPQQFCQLSQALIDNNDEVFILTLVTERNGDRLLHRIQNTFCPNTVASYVVHDPPMTDAEVVLNYGIENKIDLLFVDDVASCELLKRNGILSLFLSL